MKKEGLLLKALSDDKTLIRKEILEIRRNLSADRRKQASFQLLQTLPSYCKGFPYVLSFAPFANEIDLWQYNEVLANEKRLLLPKRSDEGLILFRVDNLSEQLEGDGLLLEPIPHKCTTFPIKNLRCALIPGVAFDTENMRIGYGKGHYDRLLKQTVSCLKIGIGFQEQLVDYPLPAEPHDQKLDEVLIF